MRAFRIVVGFGIAAACAAACRQVSGVGELTASSSTSASTAEGGGGSGGSCASCCEALGDGPATLCAGSAQLAHDALVACCTTNCSAFCTPASCDQVSQWCSDTPFTLDCNAGFTCNHLSDCGKCMTGNDGLCSAQHAACQ